MFRGDIIGKYKEAIFNIKDQEKLIKECKTDKEFLIIWLFLNTGIHPKDLGNLKISNIDGEFIIWKRAKNSKPRREMLPSEIIEKLKKYLKWKQRPKGRTSMWNIVHDVGERAGFKDISPMTLRHTFCINLLKEYGSHPQSIDFVAKRMGCSREVVVQNYIDLHQWEKLRG